jgi:hypothetical protein
MIVLLTLLPQELLRLNQILFPAICLIKEGTSIPAETLAFAGNHIATVCCGVGTTAAFSN